MFDSLSPMDWIFLVAALALGFGGVKFMLANHSGGQDSSTTSEQPQDGTGAGDSTGREKDGQGQS